MALTSHTVVGLGGANVRDIGRTGRYWEALRSHALVGLAGAVIYCEATHVCYIEDAREVTHVILMLLVDQG